MLAGHRRGPPRAGLCADRHGQDPRRVPLGHRPARPRRTSGRHGPHPLRVAAQGAEQRRAREPRHAPAGDRGDLRRGRRAVPRAARRDAQRRHAAVRAPAHGEPSPRDPHHHAREPEPPALLARRPLDARRPGHGDPGRDPRGGRDQAGHAPRHGGRAPGAALGRVPAHRAFRDGPAARGGGRPRGRLRGRPRTVGAVVPEAAGRGDRLPDGQAPRDQRAVPAGRRRAGDTWPLQPRGQPPAQGACRRARGSQALGPTTSCGAVSPGSAGRSSPATAPRCSSSTRAVTPRRWPGSSTRTRAP